VEAVVTNLGDELREKGGLLRLVPLRFRRLARFGMAGVASTIFYFVATNILLLLTSATPVLASILAYLLSWGVSYLLQSRFTFGVASDSTAQVVKFLLTAAVGLAVSSGAMFVVTETFLWPSYAGAAVVCILIPVANYFVFRSWVFRQTDERPPPPESGDRREDHK
jgi:putative flippase GtrA